MTHSHMVGRSWEDHDCMTTVGLMFVVCTIELSINEADHLSLERTSFESS